MSKKYSLLLILLLPTYSLVYAQDMMNAPILPQQVWKRYDSEALASGDQRKDAVTLFLLSRTESNGSKALELVRKSSEIINRLYRRNRNDMLLALLSGMINLGVAGESSRLKDRISYSNRGLANYEFVLPNIPDNLEAKQIYLRTTITIPTYFKNLTKKQWQQAHKFFDGYEAALAKLPSEQHKRLEELKTHVLILAAQLANRKRKTRSEIPRYLAQVDTSFFPVMKQQGDGDLVEMYYQLKK